MALDTRFHEADGLGPAVKGEEVAPPLYTDALAHVSRTIRPDAELTARYEERYQKFRQIYPACKGLFQKLAL